LPLAQVLAAFRLGSIAAISAAQRKSLFEKKEVARIKGKARHFSAQNVDELRQVVEAESVDDAADKGGFRFAVQVSARFMHGAAELERPELATASACSLLPNQDRATAVAFYGDSHDDHQRQEKSDQPASDNPIAEPLKPRPFRIRPPRPQTIDGPSGISRFDADPYTST
jgi:hypothetical protein